MLWKSSYLYRILFIFLCLGVISSIAFLNTRAEVVNTSVTISVCGNGTIEGNEVCDDDNTTPGDGCSADCLSDETCGNGIVDAIMGEECDDENLIDGDGCSSTCQTEAGAVCGDGSCDGDETCSSCPADCGTCPSGGGGALRPPVTTKVILQGKVSPAAYLTILKDGQVLVNTQADSQANFRVEISNISGGVYTFGIWAEDKNGVKSITFSFTVNVINNVTTTVSGIFIPPTISLSKESVERGETLDISGMTAPQSLVEVHINSDEIVEKLSTGVDGVWFYAFDTSRVAEGIHSVQAKASTIDDLLSTFSRTLLFGVGVDLLPAEGLCPYADLNQGGKVNLIDFSILLYWWGRYNECADQNQDGVVNLIDFSIMMYYWTG